MRKRNEGTNSLGACLLRAKIPKLRDTVKRRPQSNDWLTNLLAAREAAIADKRIIVELTRPAVVAAFLFT